MIGCKLFSNSQDASIRPRFETLATQIVGVGRAIPLDMKGWKDDHDMQFPILTDRTEDLYLMSQLGQDPRSPVFDGKVYLLDENACVIKIWERDELGSMGGYADAAQKVLDFVQENKAGEDDSDGHEGGDGPDETDDSDGDSDGSDDGDSDSDSDGSDDGPPDFDFSDIDSSGYCKNSADWRPEHTFSTDDGEVTCGSYAALMSMMSSIPSEDDSSPDMSELVDMSAGWDCTGKSITASIMVNYIDSMGCCGIGPSACDGVLTEQFSGICEDSTEWDPNALATMNGTDMSCGQMALYLASDMCREECEEEDGKECTHCLTGEDLSPGWDCSDKPALVAMTVSTMFTQAKCCGGGSNACQARLGSQDFSGMCEKSSDFIPDYVVENDDGSESSTCRQAAFFSSTPGEDLAGEDLSAGWDCTGKSEEIVDFVRDAGKHGCCGNGKSACGVPVDPDKKKKTPAPTPAPTPQREKVFVVKAEIALSLSKETWKESGEKAFKKSVAASLGVDPKNVVILSVTEVTVRRMLRILTEGTPKLEVDFQVDVTKVVKANEEEKPTMTEEAITKEVVAEVSAVIEADKLVEDLKKDTGVETLTLEVTEQPVDEVIDPEIQAMERADTHDQHSAKDSWKHFVICDPDDVEACVPFYASLSLACLAICCCCTSCLVKCFGRNERKERAAKKHKKLAKKRSTKKDFELPSGFGGMRDSEFSEDMFTGVNPMANNAGKQHDKYAYDGGGNGDKNAKKRWHEELTDDGNVYYVNDATGETSWTPPSDTRSR